MWDVYCLAETIKLTPCTMDTIGGHPVSSVPVIVASEQRLHVTCRDTPQLPGLLLEHPPHEDDRSKVELLLCVCLRPPRSWSSVMSTSAAWSHHSHTAEPALTGCELQVPLLRTVFTLPTKCRPSTVSFVSVSSLLHTVITQ